MQILLVSDLHYTLRQLDWVVSVAGDYDLVVLAGDLLDISSVVEPDAQNAVILEYLSRLAAKTTVIACSGNHDLNAQNEFDEQAAKWLDAARASGVFVDGTHFETDQEFITVCPWWDGPSTREVVGRQLAADAELVGDRRWIWVYHAPPSDSPTSWTGKRFYGDDDLVTWIEKYQPGLVFCGHVHQSPFANGGAWIDRIGSSVIFNAGRQIGPIPCCVELDTETALATWSSLAGVEEESFAAGW